MFVMVLHAVWNCEQVRLLVWAETSENAKRKSHGQRVEKPRKHPFALSSGPLKSVLGEVFENRFAENAESEIITVFLPSRPDYPLPSPKLVFNGSEPYEKPEGLAPWIVPAVSFKPADALDFLLSLSKKSYDVAFGDSVLFFSEAAKFSLELAARQCFAPALNKSGKSAVLSASWSLIFSEKDSERLKSLSKSMPLACAAFSNQHPQETVLGFLNGIADAFIRNASPAGLYDSASASLPERWLKALLSDNHVLAAGKINAFSEEMNSWTSQLMPEKNARFRTCFKLEPPTNGNPWKLSFHLQANEDKSLLVSAEDVWKSKDTLTFLNRRFENPQERLLEDLGRASRIFPQIEESIKAARPACMKMGGRQAYQFLRETAPLFEQSGFGVLLPPWWRKPEARLSVKLQLKPKSASKESFGLMDFDSIVSFDWKISLGDEELSAAEFEKLASLKVPLVNVRGKWVEFRPDEAEKAISFFREKRLSGEMRLSEALQIGLGKEASESGLPISGMEGEGWIKNFLEKLKGSAKISDITVPETFSGSLRHYQIKGVSWLAFLEQFGLGACLADDMGLGKTIQLIALLLHERAEGKSLAPTLIICPMSIAGNWHKEISRFAPTLRIMVHHGAERLSGKAFEKEAKKHDVVITTYSLAHRDGGRLSKIEWGRIVLDEAQNIKNSAAKQTQSIRRLKSRRRIAMTGTPVENRLSELWSIMNFLNGGYLGSQENFRKRFAIPIERYRDAGVAETLKSLIQPFVLRRLKTDKSVIADLPEKMEMKVFCSLTREQASLYEAAVRDMMDKIKDSDGIGRKGLVLSAIMKLKQICNHPSQFLHDKSELQNRSGKMARLEEMLEEAITEGDSALIFTQFAEMGEMLRKHLQETLGCETLFLHGGTPKNKRDEMVRRFQAEGEPKIFVLSLKAGGVGLNLTAANHVFHFDRWWNPAVENQATDRAFRIGQKKNVQVHKFLCAGTLEERIDRMIEMKKELADKIVGAGEGWISAFSNEQLKELFELRKDAVGE